MLRAEVTTIYRALQQHNAVSTSAHGSNGQITVTNHVRAHPLGFGLIAPTSHTVRYHILGQDRCYTTDSRSSALCLHVCLRLDAAVRPIGDDRADAVCN